MNSDPGVPLRRVTAFPFCVHSILQTAFCHGGTSCLSVLWSGGFSVQLVLREGCLSAWAWPLPVELPGAGCFLCDLGGMPGPSAQGAPSPFCKEGKRAGPHIPC